jgi:hypothetical protein
MKIRSSVKKNVVLLLAVILMIPCFAVNAFAATSSISGTSSAESGSTVTFSVNVSGSEGLTGFSANINTDSGLTVTSVSGCPSGWLNTSTNNLIAMAGTNTVTSFSVTVKCTLSGNPGEKKSISISNVNYTDANAADKGGSNSYASVVIATPKSSNCDLASLSVAGATLSPAFSASKTSYSIGNVDFATTSLNISAKAADSGAKVQILANALSVGANTVSVKVTAANGAVKTYKIGVTRAQDPNYVASSDATLSSITSSAGILSPAFSSAVTEYVIYVPFETQNITLGGTAASATAKGVTGADNAALKTGTNKFTVSCTAEDGKTTKSYTVYVVRMKKFTGAASIDTGTVSTVKSVTTTTQRSSEKSASLSGVPVWFIILICILILALGFVSGFFLARRKKKDIISADDDYIEPEQGSFEEIDRHDNDKDNDKENDEDQGDFKYKR